MASKFDLNNVSKGAITLLAIAQEKRNGPQLATGATLRAALQLLSELPGKCSAGKKGMLDLTGSDEPPPTLFRFCAAIINHLERSVIDASGHINREMAGMTEFDHPVFLALGQTIAREAGMSDALGPELNAAMDRLARIRPLELQKLFVENYFGNVLQDYFDACEVRRSRPELPQETEENLRKQDGRELARLLFQEKDSQGDSVETSELLDAMKNLAKAVAEEEKKRQ